MLIVKKYGGTSLKDVDVRKLICENIKKDIKEGNREVVVVSAIGRGYDPYSTDTLIKFFFENLGYDKDEYSKLATDKQQLRLLDLMKAQGEIISSIIMTSMLIKHGIKAESVDARKLGIITNDKFGEGQIIGYDERYLEGLVSKGILPVICGFQGLSKEGDIVTLKRGGSDLTALVISKMLKCDLTEIYTDVDGVMTKDPKLSDDAKLYKTISYAKLLKMSKEGAKVMNYDSIVFAKNNNIPFKVKNTYKNNSGTLVGNFQDKLY